MSATLPACVKIMRSLLFGLTCLATCTLSAAIFVVPDYRIGSSDTNYDEDPDFAYWPGFVAAYTPGTPPYSSDLGYTEVNYPFFGGNDDARIGQHANPVARITSNDGIYTFQGGPTAFFVYDKPDYSPGTILFQTATFNGSFSLPDASSAQIYYRSSPTGPWQLANFPITATATGTDVFSHVYIAWEWDTSSLSIYDYYISFSYPERHSSLIQATLETHDTYETALEGYSLKINTNLSFGTLFGLVYKSPEKMIYKPGEVVTITPDFNTGYVFAKWITEEGDSLNQSITVTMDSDKEFTLVVAAREFTVWRRMIFSLYHGGTDMRGIWDKDVDYDSDNRNNWLEYAIAANPENSDNNTYGLFMGTVEVDNVTYPEVTFTCQIDPSDVVYTLQYSEDFVTWKDNSHPEGPFFATPEQIGVTDSGAAIMRARLLQPVSTDNVHVRLAAESN